MALSLRNINMAHDFDSMIYNYFTKNQFKIYQQQSMFTILQEPPSPWCPFLQNVYLYAAYIFNRIWHIYFNNNICYISNIIQININCCFFTPDHRRKKLLIFFGVKKAAENNEWFFFPTKGVPVCPGMNESCCLFYLFVVWFIFLLFAFLKVVCTTCKMQKSISMSQA